MIQNEDYVLHCQYVHGRRGGEVITPVCYGKANESVIYVIFIHDLCTNFNKISL